MAPTQYALGRPLQFFIRFIAKGGDAYEGTTREQLLELLSAPGSVEVSLVRKFGTGHHSGDVSKANTLAEQIGVASLWEVQGAEADPESRLLQGELVVPSDITPGFDFPTINLSVCLRLLAS